jgi:hypothetical protein
MIGGDNFSRLLTHLLAKSPHNAMDRKAKKRIEVLNQKLHKLRQQLAGARQQPDDPGEPKRLEAEIAAADAELHKLKAS